MLPFFPPPYPDELFYSLCARYHLNSGNRYVRWSMEDMFGTKNVSVSFQFPLSLSSLFEKLNQDSLLTPDMIINNLSLLPFYKPFLPRNRSEKIVRNMKKLARGSGSGEVASMVGVGRHKISAITYLRYCKCCYIEDQAQYGESYWRRSHQISPVPICHKHHIYLSDSSVKVGKVNQLISLPEAIDLKSVKSTEKCENENLIAISSETNYLLTNEVPVRGLGFIKEKMLYYLDSRSLITRTKRVRNQKIAKSLHAFYGKEQLLDVYGIDDFKWVNRIVQTKPRCVHPIYYVMLLRFLGLTIHEFFNLDRGEIDPFGQGPWKCLNPVCSYYHQSVISEVEINIQSNSRLPIGIFRCSCGYEYIRKGTDRGAANKTSKVAVKKYGKVWEEALLELKEKEKLANVANILGVKLYTVKNILKRLKSAPHSQSQSVFIQKRDKRRKAWLLAVEENPNMKRAGLISIVRAERDWLFKNDRLWLEANSPPAEYSSLIKYQNGKKYSWKNRDDSLYLKTKQAVEDILSRSEKPIRITRTRIGKEINEVSALGKYIEKIPKTKCYLETVVESLDEFRERKITWAINDLTKENKKVNKSNVLVKMSLTKGSSSRISKKIDEEIVRYNNKKS